MSSRAERSNPAGCFVPALLTNPEYLLQKRGVAVENAQDLVPALIGNFEDGAVDPGLLVFLQRRLVGWGAEHRCGQRLRIAPALLGHLAQPAQLLDDLKAAARAREPAVAIFDDAAQRVIGLPAEDDRRMRLLRRLWPGPDLVEIDHLAVILGLVLGPQRLHGEDALAHQLEAGVIARAVIFHLLDVPAAANAEDETPAR